MAKPGDRVVLHGVRAPGGLRQSGSGYGQRTVTERVIIALARGGFYNQGSPAAAFEHLETYLRGVFGFLGIEPEFVAADGLSVSPEQREASIKLALGETVRLAA